MNSVLKTKNTRYFSVSETCFRYVLNSAISVNLADFNFDGKSFSSRQEYIDNKYTITKCSFINCKSLTEGGGIESNKATFVITDTVFVGNSASVGGAAHILRCWTSIFKRLVIFLNTAQYAGGVHYDSLNEQNTTDFSFMNVSYNNAEKWGGGFRIDHGGGNITDSVFSHNTARVSSGYFDYAWKPTHKILDRNLFFNNSALSRGAAITVFHIKGSADIFNSYFIQNQCKMSAKSISMENVDGYINIQDCVFDGSKDAEVSSRFGETTILICPNTRFDIPSQQIIEESKIISSNVPSYIQ